MIKHASTSPSIPALRQTPVSRPIGSTPKLRPAVRPPIPETNADVALIDINQLAALSCLSHSYLWHAISAGTGPKALRFGKRCTRFKLSDARAWLIERAAQAEVV